MKDMLFGNLKQTAEEENINPPRLSARILARCIWDDGDIPKKDQRYVNDMCLTYFSTGEIKHKIVPPSVAVAVLSDCEVGRKKYNNLRKLIDTTLALMQM